MRTNLLFHRQRPALDTEIENRLRQAIGSDTNAPHEESGRVRAFAFINEDGFIYRTVTAYNYREQHFLAELSVDMDLEWADHNLADSHPAFCAYIRVDRVTDIFVDQPQRFDSEHLNYGQ